MNLTYKVCQFFNCAWDDIVSTGKDMHVIFGSIVLILLTSIKTSCSHEAFHNLCLTCVLLDIFDTKALYCILRTMGMNIHGCVVYFGTTCI